MADSLKLLAVFPHPDDETLGLGSTFARYSAEGVETYLVCATRGERGWFDSEGPDPGFEGVARIRDAELRCAAENLGIHKVNFLDYIDGDVDQADPEEIIGKIVSHIRHIKPQVVVSFPPDGAYNEAFGGISMDVDGVTRHHVGWEDWQITTRLDNNKYLDKVQKAILCHKSQLSGYGPIAEWSLAELEPIFGTGSFYRAFSLVNGGRKVETDLFEGLR